MMGPCGLVNAPKEEGRTHHICNVLAVAEGDDRQMLLVVVWISKILLTRRARDTLQGDEGLDDTRSA